MKFPKEINCHQAPGPSVSVPRDPWDEFTELSINTAHQAQPRVTAAGQGGAPAPTSVCFRNVTILHHPPRPGKFRAVGRGPEQCSSLEDPNPEVRRDLEVLEVPKLWTSWG